MYLVFFKQEIEIIFFCMHLCIKYFMVVDDECIQKSQLRLYFFIIEIFYSAFTYLKDHFF
jgi:hypothetical protein